MSLWNRNKSRRVPSSVIDATSVASLVMWHLNGNLPKRRVNRRFTVVFNPLTEEREVYVDSGRRGRDFRYHRGLSEALWWTGEEGFSESEFCSFLEQARMVRVSRPANGAIIWWEG